MYYIDLNTMFAKIIFYLPLQYLVQIYNDI